MIRSMCLGLALILTGTWGACADPPARPNVLFIAVDDLNCNLGCYGHSLVKSPNMDRLAERGVRFDRAYCQYPLCNPSRTSLLSGRRPDATQVLDNTTPSRKHLKDVAFLPEHFQKAGYFTARVGKIAHGAFEDAVKWDEAAKAAGNRPQQPNAQQQPKPQQQQQAGGIKISWRATPNADEAEQDGRTARRIVELIDQHKDRPFFIAAGFHKPHLPFNAPKKYFDLYPPEKITLPREPADVRTGIPANAFTRTASDAQMTDAEKRQAIAAYYACVSFTDAQVGLLLDALDRHKLWDRTIVVFWGDHGFHLGEHAGMWRKMSLFEESARVPLIVAAPGMKKGAVSPRLVELVDLYPTLTDLCGLTPPAGLEGSSFRPLLGNPEQPWKKGAFTVVSRGKGVLGRTVRTERYRYTEWGDPAEAELYDHQNDPQEFKNLVNDSKHASTLVEMRRLLKGGWQAALPAAASKEGNQ